MDILAISLRYWCAYKLNTDPAWASLKVIISDATVPGEGEHKIMDFVRSQRASPDYDPNTHHVIYGLDADLIMLALATHEPHFRVLREDVFAQDSRPRLCKICGQKGHDAMNCRGEEKEKEGEFDEKDNAAPLKPFIWLHIPTFREYLAIELFVPDLPFRFDLERAIDDWVFLCCFVGNDFLPHLPALEIRENGIHTLTAIWRDNLPFMGGYVTRDGHIDLKRAQVIMDGLAKQEDAIFKRRKAQDDRRDANAKRRRLQEQSPSRGGHQGPRGRRHNVDTAPSGLGSLRSISDMSKSAAVTHDMVVDRNAANDANAANRSAASVLKSRLSSHAPDPAGSAAATPTQSSEAQSSPVAESPSSILGKRKAVSIENGPATSGGGSTPGGGTQGTPNLSAEDGPVDTVRLWEDGYADRYYEQKFHVDSKDTSFRHQVARSYVEGLAWVLLYYYQGCPSWEWYYPYHYAPFAKDFVGLENMDIKFEKGRISRPFEQLMSVLPAASRRAIPEVFHDLMTNEDSEIIDFYPEDFEIDLNGKKMAWQGVALLPFIDMPRLLKAVEGRYPQLSSEDAARNGVGKVTLLLSDAHPDLYGDITSHFYSKKQGSPNHKLDPRLSDGLSGSIEKIDEYLPHGPLEYPLERKAMPNLDYDRSLSVSYEIPATEHAHKSMLLRGVRLPKPALDRSDIEALKRTLDTAGRSHGGVPLGGGGRGDRFSFAPRGMHSNGRGRGGRGGYHHQALPPFPQHPSYGQQSQPFFNPPPPLPSFQQQQRQRQQQPWIPPPPGHPNFGTGMPPPPPSYPYDGRQWGSPGTPSGPGHPNDRHDWQAHPLGRGQYRGGAQGGRGGGYDPRR